MSGLYSPGDRVGRRIDVSSGTGTYLYNDYVLASLFGPATYTSISDSQPKQRPTRELKENPSAPQRTVQINRIKNGIEQVHLLPEIGDIVLARVTKATQRHATLVILAIGSNSSTDPMVPARDEFPAVIRAQDVRMTEKDKVKINSSFRPGDIVRASVLSLGDHSGYYLTTGRNDLGVIYATTEEGLPMYPVSWKEMRCFETGEVQNRKVADPFAKI